MGNKAIFLDRDGTINKEKHYLYKIEDFEYIEGAIDSMKILYDKGYILVVVTNQSGIARGYYTEDDYITLDKWMRNDLLTRGVKISGSYYCPHLQNGSIKKYAVDCNCRKPRTALYWEAAKELDIDMNQSFAIGDSIRDLSICKESGVIGFLLSDSNKKYETYESCCGWENIVKKINEIENERKN